MKTLDIDIRSKTWQNIKSYFEERLQTLRQKNDAPATSEETERTRGQIMEVKMILSAGKKIEQLQENRN